MRVLHQHDFHRAPLGWNSGLNLFSLMFALLLALAFLVLLMLYFDVLQRPKPPSPTSSSVGRVVPMTLSAASRFRSRAET